MRKNTRRVNFPLMKNAATFLAATALSLVGAVTNECMADMIYGNTELSNPGTLITFGGTTWPMGSNVTDNFADQGVTFSSQSGVGSPLFLCGITSGSGLDPLQGIVLANYYQYQGSSNPPFRIHFNTPVTEAGFHMLTHTGDSTFYAYLDGSYLEYFEAASGGLGSVAAPNTFFGFKDIVLDEIYVIPAYMDGDTPRNGAMMMDNLQFTVVPTPGAFLLGALGLGFAGMKLRKRRASYEYH